MGEKKGWGGDVDEVNIRLKKKIVLLLHYKTGCFFNKNSFQDSSEPARGAVP